MKFYGKPKQWIEDPICKLVFGKTDDQGCIDVENDSHVIMIERLIESGKLQLSKNKPAAKVQTKSDNPLDELAKSLNQNPDLNGLEDPIPEKPKEPTKAELQAIAKEKGIEFKSSDSKKVLSELIAANER